MMCSLHGTCAERSTIQHCPPIASSSAFPPDFLSFCNPYLFLFPCCFFIFYFFFLLALSFKDDTSTQQIGGEVAEVLFIFWISEIERDLDQSEAFCRKKDILTHCVNGDLYCNVVPMTSDDH